MVHQSSKIQNGIIDQEWMGIIKTQNQTRPILILFVGIIIIILLTKKKNWQRKTCVRDQHVPEKKEKLKNQLKFLVLLGFIPGQAKGDRMTTPPLLLRITGGIVLSEQAEVDQ